MFLIIGWNCNIGEEKSPGSKTTTVSAVANGFMTDLFNRYGYKM